MFLSQVWAESRRVKLVVLGAKWRRRAPYGEHGGNAAALQLAGMLAWMNVARLRLIKRVEHDELVFHMNL